MGLLQKIFGGKQKPTQQTSTTKSSEGAFVKIGNIGYLKNDQGGMDMIWISSERYDRGVAGLEDEIAMFFHLLEARGEIKVPLEFYAGIHAGFKYDCNIFVPIADSLGGGYFLSGDTAKLKERLKQEE